MNRVEGRGLGRAQRVLRQLAPYVAPYRWKLVWALFLTAAVVLLGIVRPWPIKVVVDQVILGQEWDAIPAWASASPTRLLALCAGLVLLLAALAGIANYVKTIALATVGQRVVAQLRDDLHHRLLRLSLAYHDKQSSGDLLVRLSGDTIMMRQLLVEGIFAFGQEVAMVAGVLTVIAWLDWQLALVAGVIVPIVVTLMVFFGRRLRAVSRRQRGKEGLIGASIQESLGSVEVIQAYGLEDEAQARFAKRNRKSLKAGLRGARLEGSLSGWTELALAAGTAATLWIGTLRVLAGQLSPGEMLVLLSYVRSLYKPLRRAVTRSSRLYKSLACGERVLEVLAADASLPLDPEPIVLGNARGSVQLDAVQFAYDPKRRVFDELSLELEAGEVVAIVGDNGSGKSTLAGFLARLRDVDGGSVLIDGIDVRRLDLASLRSAVTVLFQDTVLFDATIRDNIRLGRPDASDEAVAHAAAVSGVVEYCRRLPDGLDTQIGERGHALSGGERKRLALARALLRDSRIVVLDEPTAALDAGSERRFVDELLTRLRGRTVILMTHNRSLLSEVDRVFELRRGRLTETHRQRQTS